VVAERRLRKVVTERRLLLGVLLILALLVPVGAWTVDRARQASSDADQTPAITVGAESPATVQTYPPDRKLPTLPLTTLDGRKLDLVAYRGRPLMLNFWATWCDPCVREFPLLRRTLDQRAGPDKLAIVGVLVNDKADKARAFMRAHGGTWPVAQDQGGRGVAALGIFGLPETVFVRPDGTMSSRVLGELTEQRLDKELERLRGGS
jgi:cytochrome c biogenesis protein CcmG, thiol:disulfide interchange protein DsbE